ncbi:MAG: response regulator [Anaerolineae bacterium]|nr:response regulator [Anaerolineae bacterium]
MKQTTRILIVEDGVSLARTLHHLLSSPEGGGYDVEVCHSGEAALKKLDETHFDLVISDFNLPGMNGLEVLKCASIAHENILTLLMTTFEFPRLGAPGLDVADVYLAKPFDPNEFIAIIHKMLYPAR